MMDDQELAARVEAHRARLAHGMDPRTQAEAEAKLVRNAVGRAYFHACRGVAEWLARTLGGPPGAYALRSSLLGAGAGAELLWERIAGDMPPYTAIKILRAAKHALGVNIHDYAARLDATALRGAIEGELRRYDAQPFTRAHAGKVLKKSKPKSKRSSDKRLSWSRLRAEVEIALAPRLVGLDPQVAAAELRRLEVELKVVLDQASERLHQLRGAAKRQADAVGRTALLRACGVLAIDPPPPDRPVDLALLRRQTRRFGRLYHPDAHGGDEATRPQYEVVMDAARTIERYNELLGIPNLAVVQGGKQENQANDDQELNGGGSGA